MSQTRTAQITKPTDGNSAYAHKIAIALRPEREVYAAINSHKRPRRRGFGSSH